MSGGWGRVYVLSWVYWNGTEQGGGGFDWYDTEAAALAAWQHERETWPWSPSAARMRLVPFDLPRHVYVPSRSDQSTEANRMREAITRLVDMNLDDVEDHHATRALRVWIDAGGAAA